MVKVSVVTQSISSTPRRVPDPNAPFAAAR